MTINERLMKACINIAGLARKMEISPPLFSHRFTRQRATYDNLEQLVKVLDILIFELVSIREDVSKQAWELKKGLLEKLSKDG